MKLAGKAGTGKLYAGFDEVGDENELLSTAPVRDPTDDRELEIGLLSLRERLILSYHRFPVRMWTEMGWREFLPSRTRTREINRPSGSSEAMRPCGENFNLS